MSWPDAAALQQFHYEGLQGIYFDELVSTRTHTVLFSKHIRDSYYNFVSARREDSAKDVLEHKSLFESRQRQLAAYVGPDAQPALTEDLSEHRFEVSGTDSWLGIDLERFTPDVSLPSTIDLEYVDQRGSGPYVDAFSRAYSSDEEDDPYGQLDTSYITALEQSFSSPRPHSAGFGVRYLQAVSGSQVVGVAMIVQRHELAGIYGVGVDPRFRKKGIGRALTDRLASDAGRNGASKVFLQTEHDSAVEQWYISFGYAPLFTATYWTQSAAGA